MEVEQVDVAKVIEAAGGVKALAEACNVHHTSVIGWRNAGRIPPERCQVVAAAAKMTLHELRPDIYPLPSETAA